jgi:peptide chain release factor 1
VADRLPDILARYRELTTALEDPDVATNQARLREILKERGGLERRAQLYEEFLNIRTEITDTEGLVEELGEVAEEELVTLRTRRAELTESLADEMAADEADAARSVIMEIRPGTGGDEAALFARDLLEMYRRYAETKRLKFEILGLQLTDLGGVREAIFSLSGAEVYRMLKFEAGGHRVQRVPETGPRAASTLRPLPWRSCPSLRRSRWRSGRRISTSTPCARAARAARRSTRPSRPSGSPISPPGSW